MGATVTRSSHGSHRADSKRIDGSMLIRREWMFTANTAAQHAACLIANGHSRTVACRDLLKLAAEPTTRIEELALLGLLFEAVIGGCPPTWAERRARTERVLEILGTKSERAQREREIADAAAAAIAIDPSRPLDVEALARGMGHHPSVLRRMFMRYTGMSMREYHVRARVKRAEELFRNGISDVLAVARLVGYKSEKNFYRAVRRVLGVTPAQLRTAATVRLVKMAPAGERPED